MPFFKVWSEDKLKKKFVVAENFGELVSKEKKITPSLNFLPANAV